MKVTPSLSMVMGVFFLFSGNYGLATEVTANVAVTGGEIEGTINDNGLKTYLGIPYAAPPVGTLRWAPTAEVESWEGVRSAKKVGSPCVQVRGMNHFYDSNIEGMSEDCLFLNIWTPAESVEDKLPVMVWIHGGAFVQGNGGDWDGANLSQKGVIVVTINYRLGPFGFFAHPELTAENAGLGSGNQAFFDQIAALQWIQDNIQKFGGDASNVTIFGESAGSWSMSVLQASPLARGLFHKVIGQSGARFLPMWYRSRASNYAPSAESYGKELARVFSPDRDLTLEGLRSLPASQIIAAYESNPEILFNFDALAIVDGQVLPEEVDAIFSKGLQADVPVLIGSNEDEAVTFAPDVVDPTIAESADYRVLLAQLGDKLLPEAGEPILELYPANSLEEARQSWIELHTDVVFSQSMVYWANKMSNVSSDTFLYWWNWHPSIKGSTAYKAFHAAELSYVFGSFGGSSGYGFNVDDVPPEREFSALMMDIWTNFAKTGNPSVEGIIDWPAYDPADPKHVVLGSDVYVTGALRKEKIEFITEAYRKQRAGSSTNINDD